MFTSLEKSSYGYLLCEMIEDAKSTPLSRAREAVQRVAGLSNCGQLDVPRRRGRVRAIRRSSLQWHSHPWQTLLQLASEHNKPDFVRLLLEASASVHPRLTTSEVTKFITASHNQILIHHLIESKSLDECCTQPQRRNCSGPASSWDESKLQKCKFSEPLVGVKHASWWFFECREM